MPRRGVVSGPWSVLGARHSLALRPWRHRPHLSLQSGPRRPGPRWDTPDAVFLQLLCSDGPWRRERSSADGWPGPKFCPSHARRGVSASQSAALVRGLRTQVPSSWDRRSRPSSPGAGLGKLTQCPHPVAPPFPLRASAGTQPGGPHGSLAPGWLPLAHLRLASSSEASPGGIAHRVLRGKKFCGKFWAKQISMGRIVSPSPQNIYIEVLTPKPQDPRA